MKKIELLVPAGNFEKLEIAIHYGADAVYMAGKKFSLRNFSGNFSLEELFKARELTLKYNVKMYIAVNVYSRDDEKKDIDKYLHNLKEISPDAIIVADPAIFVQARQVLPEIPLHISTQANTTNTSTVLFWQKFGATRVNLARELNLKEISKIVKKSNIEIETFVHGSMCIAYSGRCLISNFMTQRDSNRGTCCQPCRFSYSVVESKRPGEYFPIFEDEHGSYIFSSKDLCMIDYIPDLIDAGITSLKIEGRMKSINYLAVTTKIYRDAIDTYYALNGNNNSSLKYWHRQLKGVRNRGYSTGFFFNAPEQVAPPDRQPIKFQCLFAAKVIKATSENKTLVNVRNKIYLEDKIQIISPFLKSEKCYIIKGIYNENGIELSFAQPNMNVYIYIDKIKCRALDLILKK